MNILIFGASGATGRELVKQAIFKGHEVTAFLRQQSKFSLNHKDIKVVRGDINNLHDLKAAIAGKDAVLSALGANSPFKYDQTVVEGVHMIMKAMKLCAVNRFVYLSTMGVSGSRGRAGIIVKYLAPVLLSTEIRGHETREKLIVESDLGWTIVRPPTLTNGKHLGQYRSGEDIKSKSLAATISRADVADFMLEQLDTTRYLFSKPAVMY